MQITRTLKKCKLAIRFIWDLPKGEGELHEQQECTYIHEGRGGN